MSKRNWVIAAALGLAIAVILIGAAGLQIANRLLVVWEQHDQYQGSASRKTEQAVSKAYRQCQVGSAPADWSELCLVEQVSAYAEHYDRNEDLRAQRDMAFWAFAMFITSALGLVVSMGGVGLLLVSLAQTRRAIADTREIGEAQVRAYVTVESAFVEMEMVESSVVWHVELTVKNFGQSPAKAAFATITNKSFDEPGRTVARDLGAGVSHTSPVVVSTPFSDLVFLDDSRNVIVFGMSVTVSYDDVFGNGQNEVCGFFGKVTYTDGRRTNLHQVNVDWQKREKRGGD